MTAAASGPRAALKAARVGARLVPLAPRDRVAHRQLPDGLPVVRALVLVALPLDLAALWLRHVALGHRVLRLAVADGPLKPLVQHVRGARVQVLGGQQVDGGQAVVRAHRVHAHARDLGQALLHLGRVRRAQRVLAADVAAVVQQQLRVRHALRRVLRRHILEHKLVGEAHNLVLLRGGQQDGVEAAVLPVVLQARLVVDQLQLAVLVDEDVLRVPVALRGEQVKD
eukprot:CAMPEP_0202859854 /NCGR_PEP_ID=MMETSP1391-20130828/1802_1 /ASSEMBLY_ACC=CAM_ASM_000867 /TAXON_ID=1034604 /ORGANISM="Chlamydomonas leiostraca, Strain SAG 11-49" /LENGTH=225 /DNA_ID=CAMNT_0049538949 /DNA_START=149 /DNA_END=823 /DNA_ORIENTATION=-